MNGPTTPSYSDLEPMRVARVRTQAEASKFCPPRVTFEDGCTDYTFELGRDGKWRHTYTSTYGNGSMVYGTGCDASGRVITDEATLVGLAELAEVYA